MSQLIQDRYGLPILITENNGQQLWKGDTAGETRYLVENLQWVSYAVAQGVDIRGFYYWAFMDNYEWNHGMTVDLGLYAVDEDDPDKERRARPMVEPYSRVAGAGAVPEALRQRYPVELEAAPTGGVPDSTVFTGGWK
jgi:beta-glucosidase